MHQNKILKIQKKNIKKRMRERLKINFSKTEIIEIEK